MNLPSLTLDDIRRGLLAKQFSAAELTAEALKFAEAENPKTGAYLRLSPERALEGAQRVDQRIARAKTPARWPERP